MDNDANPMDRATSGGSSAAREQTRAGRFYRPNVDIVENENELLLKADLPGASAESISLDYNGGNLVLHAAVAVRQPENTTYLIREYGVADFHREFQVNEEIDSGKIAAEYRDGVLTVHLPKAEAAKPRRIAVKAN